MIGVTIRKGKEFHSLSEKAVSLFRKNTGIKNVLIIDTEDENPYIGKLHLAHMLQQTFVFFDADHWIVNECDLSQYDNRPDFFAALDVGRNKKGDFPIEDCHWHGIDSNRYFNTGFFIANGRDELTRRAFHYAFKLIGRLRVQDFGEQTFLNIAIQRFHVPFTELPYEYNYAILCEEGSKWDITHTTLTSHQYLKHPIGVHAMGYHKPYKMKILNKYLKLKHHEQPLQLPTEHLPVLQPELRPAMPVELSVPRTGHNGNGGHGKGGGRQRRGKSTGREGVTVKR